MRWIRVEEAIIEDSKRYETFSSAYSETDPMRYRIFEGQFIKLMKEVTHVRLLTPPSDEQPDQVELADAVAFVKFMENGRFYKANEGGVIIYSQGKQRYTIEQLYSIFKSQSTGKQEGQEEWVSVEERLPQTLVNVLVHYDDGITGYITRGFYSYENKVVWNVQSYSDKIKDANVTHWQPLPAPPIKVSNH
jgi:hypothetical protein